jgi:hypothetical protein
VGAAAKWFSPVQPVALMAAIAYLLLQQAIIRAKGWDSILKKAVGRDRKARCRRCFISWQSWWRRCCVHRGSLMLFVATALLWLIPDRRIEKRLAK